MKKKKNVRYYRGERYMKEYIATDGRWIQGVGWIGFGSGCGWVEGRGGGVGGCCFHVLHQKCVQ